MKTVGERLDYLRRKDKLSYNDLAKALNEMTSDGVRKAIVNNRLKLKDISFLAKNFKWHEG